MTPTPEFFNVQPVQAALAMLFEQWQPPYPTETVDLRNGLHRILAVDTHAPIDLPTFPRSTMDGYAVRAADTFGASQSLPAYLQYTGTVKMGAEATQSIERGQTLEIHTGGMLPPNADAVVMVERTQQIDADEIEVLAPVAPGENVIQIGEDVAKGDLILSAGHRLRAQDIGGLMAVGITEVEAIRPPRVGVLSCGDELVTPDVRPQMGQIRDINAYTLMGLIEEGGGEPVFFGIAHDTLEDYEHRARIGFHDVDMLVMTAGSSVSTRDLTRQVINSLGTPGVLQHGLAVKPGKPTILAMCDNKPVIGLPGNPVSALLVARQIVLPIMQHALGQAPHFPRMISATLTANLASTTGRDDTVPVRLIKSEHGYDAEPVFGKSNLIYTLVNADGLIHIPLNSNGLRTGESVSVLLF